MLGQRGCHSNSCGIGYTGEWGRSGCDLWRALPFPVGGSFGLKDVSGVFQEGSPVRKVLMFQDLLWRIIIVEKNYLQMTNPNDHIFLKYTNIFEKNTQKYVVFFYCWIFLEEIHTLQKKKKLTLTFSWTD